MREREVATILRQLVELMYLLRSGTMLGMLGLRMRRGGGDCTSMDPEAREAGAAGT